MNCTETRRPQEEKMNRDPLLDQTGAAEYLSLSHRTLEKWRSVGGGPRYTKLGKRAFYRVSDLEQFIAGGGRSSTSDSGAGAQRERGK